MGWWWIIGLTERRDQSGKGKSQRRQRGRNGRESARGGAVNRRRRDDDGVVHDAMSEQVRRIMPRISALSLPSIGGRRLAFHTYTWPAGEGKRKGTGQELAAESPVADGDMHMQSQLACKRH